jgi:hypothetical protein
MTKVVNIWAPILKENDRPTMSLAVRSGTTAPDKAEYRERLCDLLDELISANPKQARWYLEAMGGPSGYAPELASIPVGSPIKHWAPQILQVDLAEMLLNRIDWQRDNPPRKLSEDNLPSFMDILQML